MDSEDEREMQRESEQRAERCYFPRRPCIEMRLFEREEADLKISMERDRANAKKNKEGTGQTQNDEPEEPHVEDDCFYRFYKMHRFFATFEGFHEGSLDLTGRHERRYMSLKSRMTSFLEDIEHLRLYSTRVEYVPSIPLSGQSVLFEYEIPSPILDPFMDKYKLTENSFSLRYLFRSADDVRKLLSSHPQPVFQKLLLADLPIELIHHIMELGDVDVARRLAATCRRFYEISSAHAYKSRQIVFDSALILNDDHPPPGSEAWGQYLHSAAHKTRRKLFDDISFLSSRPDIIHRIRDFKIGCEWHSSILAKAGLEVESDAHIKFFVPIWRAVEDILPSITNVTRIVMCVVPLSKRMIHAIEMISTLRTLRFD
ncbi:uncharacterized protein LAESUDRAFT_104354 [Laetiporus sulphureus 93-53]|uniref:F-box domain-containing protein n=1 Tax=Laetiporus sulphureus 93-53 TaxID=1314785 RepID=A0A165ETQ0_9APHY|nr:uncharacterized protein LAESUDRAFT_104354 [Laetiporus sulphureus 93-53]KZT07739.1 hypothetical protein LAESUDRAFT_104354 [Laetiporus sulphureus 93-53]